jgi:hypothetical protein
MLSSGTVKVYWALFKLAAKLKCVPFEYENSKDGQLKLIPSGARNKAIQFVVFGLELAYLTVTSAFVAHFVTLETSRVGDIITVLLYVLFIWSGVIATVGTIQNQNEYMTLTNHFFKFNRYIRE